MLQKGRCEGSIVNQASPLKLREDPFSIKLAFDRDPAETGLMESELMNYVDSLLFDCLQ